MSFADREQEYAPDLLARTDAASQHTYISNKADIVEYFKDTYGAKWTAAAAAAQTGQTSGRSYQSAMRGFQGGRENSVPRTAKDKAKWAEFGKQLPPIGRKPPRNGYKVSVKGQVKVSEGRKSAGPKGPGGRRTYNGKMRGNGWAKANFVRTITGADAVEFANNPNFQQIFSIYFENFQANPVTDFSIDEFSVEPNDEEE